MPYAGSVGEVFRTFSILGLTSFGGPIAHLGYYRRELVERRRWLDESEYAQLVGLCQFLPGPASSQVGFAIGLLRAGWLGGLAAFIAFSLPSVLALLLFALWLPDSAGSLTSAAIQGLKIVALAVVAHAVLGMSRQLCFGHARPAIAALAAALVLVWSNPWDQLVVVLLGAIGGLIFCQPRESLDEQMLAVRYRPFTGVVLLAVFFVLLLLLPVLAQSPDGPLAIANGFYRSGALVFGGGHVVLPLLEGAVVAPGWVGQDAFLAGYGAAQAIPGPVFSIAAFLGAQIGILGTPGTAGGHLGLAIGLALLATVAIFLPGFLLVAGVLPVWGRIAKRPNAGRAIAGINAAVVGLLAAALYDPVFSGAVHQPVDLAIALLAFTLLAAWRAPALSVVLFCVLARVLWTALQSS